MARTKKLKQEVLSGVSNDSKSLIEGESPYIVTVTIRGTADLLFHKWSNEDVDIKSKASKGSKTRKTDNIESYVYRNEEGFISIPGEYLRQAIIHASKFKQDPRSPRKSAMDLFKAGIISLTELAPVGKESWDYLDMRRVIIQRSAITRTRPAMRKGWTAEFQFEVLLPEYISPDIFQEVLTNAGRLIGLADFRPTYGRFVIEKIKFK